MSSNGLAKDGKRRRFFVYKLLKDHALKERLASRLGLARKRSRDGCGTSLTRCLAHVRFCVVCSASLFKAMAPWGFAACEVAVMLLLYSLLIPNALPVRRHISHYRYHFRRSLEDVVAFSILRFLAVVLAYVFGTGRNYHRPYMYTAYAFAAVGVPFVLVKLLLFKLPHHWLPHVTLMAASLAFSAAHLLMAKNVMEWARQRYQMGLLGYGYPWEEGEEAWLLMGRSQTLPDTAEERPLADVDPRSLADPDSRFADCQGLTVHYKEEVPAEGCAGDTGVVLIHGFGGGVFAWRHIMPALAQHCNCRVVAFDRPAFGLTSRPLPRHGEDAWRSPYSLAAQAELTLALCTALGLRRAVFVGHADGALVALLAANLACRRPDSPCWAAPADSMDMAWMLGTPGNAELAAEHSSLSRLQVSPFKSLPSPQKGRMLFSGLRSHYGSAGDVQQAPSAACRQASFASLADEEAPESPGSRNSAEEVSCTTRLLPGQRTSSGHSGVHHMDLPPGLSSPMTRGYPPPSVPSQPCAAYRPPQPHLESGASTSYLSTPFADPASQSRPPYGCPMFPSQSWGRGGDPGSSSGSLPQSQGAHSYHQNDRGQGEGQGAVGGSAECEREYPEVLGMALLHPSLSGEVGPSFTRLLGKSRLGRRILRPLLRSELGEVGNRRAWADVGKLTEGVLALYKAPLHVVNWDTALIEVSRVKGEIGAEQLAECYRSTAQLLALVVTGDKDRIVPPQKAAIIAGELPHARLHLLPDCGHLSHEEVPGELLDCLALFVSGTLGQPSSSR
ncbi:hypothetical protein WJX72_007022 [[Myrmecia] bisecta]|uniref:AB hydrolase-1 domain-containing protein n=1 Tax=[Myrmecia] bisecta TaxID=41462 RepID=A0AAW1PDV1_9CHLO